MVNLLPWDVQAGEINTFVLELQLFLQESDRQLSDIHVNVGCFHSLYQYMSHLVGKPTKWFPNRSDTNRPVQAQKRDRSLKFQI